MFQDDVERTESFEYDAIGNLVAHTKPSGMQTLEWNAYGKVKTVTKGTMTMTFGYDAQQNRLKKTVNGVTSYYIRDAQGNTLAVYEQNGSSLKWKEQDLYGSSRLGMAKPEREVTGFFWASAAYTLVAGAKSYELSNHLGNVMAVISDRGELQSAQDFYPFGMAMPGRSTDAKHRYTFNGKETDPETGLNDFGARLYDNRLGRWIAVDPLEKKYPALTPYNFVANMPVRAIDPDGKRIVIQLESKDANGKKVVESIYYISGTLYVLNPKYSPNRKTESKYISYEGTNAFALKVRDDLNELKDDDPLLGKRIERLQNPKGLDHIIVPGEENTNNAANQDFLDAGIPQSSMTTYNAYSFDGPELKRAPKCALAHELLSHGYDADRGKERKGETAGVENREIDGVNIENVSREAAGYERRTQYTRKGKKLDIPEEELKRPKND